MQTILSANVVLIAANVAGNGVTQIPSCGIRFDIIPETISLFNVPFVLASFPTWQFLFDAC